MIRNKAYVKILSIEYASVTVTYYPGKVFKIPVTIKSVKNYQSNIHWKNKTL